MEILLKALSLVTASLYEVYNLKCKLSGKYTRLVNSYSTKLHECYTCHKTLTKSCIIFIQKQQCFKCFVVFYT